MPFKPECLTRQCTFIMRPSENVTEKECFFELISATFQAARTTDYLHKWLLVQVNQVQLSLTFERPSRK